VDGAPNGISVPRSSPLSRGSGSIGRRTRSRFTWQTRTARSFGRAS